MHRLVVERTAEAAAAVPLDEASGAQAHGPFAVGEDGDRGEHQRQRGLLDEAAGRREGRHAVAPREHAPVSRCAIAPARSTRNTPSEVAARRGVGVCRTSVSQPGGVTETCSMLPNPAGVG